jgi:hypothetical protein
MIAARPWHVENEEIISGPYGRVTAGVKAGASREYAHRVSGSSHSSSRARRSAPLSSDIACTCVASAERHDEYPESAVTAATS